MEAFCVVLDTNVWRSELLLNTPNGAALLFLVKRCNAKIGLPEIVEKEIGKVLVRECLKAAKPLKTLGPLMGFEFDIESTEEAFAARVTQRLSDLASLFRRLPFTHEHARGALERIIQKLPPNGPDREQFRDSAIWEAVLEFARTETVHFVTEDKDFFRHREPKNGPAENIEGEAKRQAHRIRVHPSLPLCLAALQEVGPTVDKATVAQAIESALRGELSASAVNKGFGVGSVIHYTVTPFFTEHTGVLAMDFELTFDVDNLTNETREDARLVSSGSCFFHVRNNSISEVRKRLEEFSWRDGQGVPQKRKHYLFAETASLLFGGQKPPAPYSFRAPFEKPEVR